MSLAVFEYSWGLTGTFELPTEAARRLLPPALEPAELHHGESVLAVSAFEFSDSPLGPYGELAFAVVVAPTVRPGQVMPQAAVYPYAVCTTRPELRQMVFPQWPLPYWQDDVVLSMTAEGGKRTLTVTTGGAALLEMTLFEFEWAEESQVHQVIAVGQEGGSAALLSTRGMYSDHEDGKGELKLYAHPMHKGLDITAVDSLPLREACYRDGTRSIETLVSL